MLKSLCAPVPPLWLNSETLGERARRHALGIKGIELALASA